MPSAEARPGDWFEGRAESGGTEWGGAEWGGLLGPDRFAPSAPGAAALLRPCFVDGFDRRGIATAADRLLQSAALLKATLIASARAVPFRRDIVTNDIVDALPVPSHEQGWGFPVLDDALYLAGDSRRLHVVDVPLSAGLAEGESKLLRVNVKAGTPFKAVLVWTDAPGHIAGVSDIAPQLVNDLDLRVRTATNTYGGTDRLNNVEVVSLDEPAAGLYTIDVSAFRLQFGAKQSYALVLTGDFALASAGRARAVRH
jgi:hypothetical protein